MIKIKKGLDLPIAGEPRRVIQKSPVETHTVALVGPDYVGMKPTMLVKEGDQVKLGQALFEDKKNPGVIFTSPGSGTVKSIQRGDKRAFLNIVIELGAHGEEQFKSYDRDFLALERQEIVENLAKSGMWTAIRTRPFSKSPRLDDKPSAIFVSAMDTNPLAADPAVIINRHKESFLDGLKLLSKLSAGKLYLVQNPRSQVIDKAPSYVNTETFDGPHPAGLVGTHIHFLHPVAANKQVWHVGYQDVIAMAKLFRSGKLWTERVVAVAGPMVKEPCLVETRIGADIQELIRGKIKDGQTRVISGSVLCGRKVDQNMRFLGRFHNQISVIEEGATREFLGWQGPGFDKFSIKKIYAAAMSPWKKFAMTANLNGSHRAMVPVGTFERVMPLDIIPTFFLRSLITQDVEQAQAMGALELDEEDLALCTFVCSGKMDYGPMLRQTLTSIEKEG